MNSLPKESLHQKIAAPLGYLLVALVLTYPLIFKLNAGIPGDGMDGPMFLWNLWWVKTALLNLHQNPLWTNQIWTPFTLPLHFHTLTLLASLLSIPLQFFFSLPATLNLLFLGSLVLTAWATQRLILAWLPDHLTAWFGGLLFSFSPYVFTQALGHFNLTTLWPIPLVLLFITRYLRAPRFHWAILAGASFAAVALNELQYASFLFLFLILWAGWTLLTRTARLSTLIRLALVASTISLILSGWLIIPAVRLAHSQFTPELPTDMANYYAVEPIEFILPNFLHPVFGHWTTARYWQYRHAFSEQGVYLGWLPLALTVLVLYQLIRRRQLTPLPIPRGHILFWLFVGSLFASLSLGPTLHIHFIDTGLALPYHWLQKIPFLGWSRVASRLIVLTYLALAILASSGLWLVVRNLKPGARIAIILLASGALLFEYWTGLKFQPITIPSFYHIVKNDSAGGVLLDLPLDYQLVALQEYYQSIHQRPIVTALHSRLPSQVLAYYQSQPGIRVLAGQPIGHADRDPIQIAASLAQLNLRYIVIDRTHHAPFNQWSDPNFAAERRGYLKELLGGQSLASEDGFELWCLPTTAPCPNSS